jgi:hypothetical protein
MAINKPIERILQEADGGTDGLCVLSQIVIMRCANGLDDFLFRRASADSSLTFKGRAIALAMGDAILPNWDDRGWPIDDANIDVIDVSDWVTGYTLDYDIETAAAGSCTLTVANTDMLFSKENVTIDKAPDEQPYIRVISGDLTPRNAITGKPVIHYPDGVGEDYGFSFMPNYMFASRSTCQPDPNRFAPLFRENHVVKVREAYHNPDWNAALLPDPTQPSGHPSHQYVWVDRFLGLVSAPTPSNAEGKPALNVNCQDFMKLAAKAETQRVYAPLMVTNDCRLDASRLPLAADNSDDFDTNKVLYDPRRTSRSLKDFAYGMRPVNFQNVKEEVLASIGPDGKSALSVNQDWSPVPEPQIFMEALRCNDDGTIANPTSPTVANGAIVRWYDSYEPTGKPVRVDRWNGIDMALDRFFDPNKGAADHAFISNYGNWSLVIDTMVDIANAVDDPTASGIALFALYCEGGVKVYWDGQEIASKPGETTLADFANFLTQGAQPQPELGYQALPTNRAIVQPADDGVIAWTADIVPKGDDGKSVKLHHLKIIYQCGSHVGNRNILRLRWWGRTAAQRNALIQNASALEASVVMRTYNEDASSPSAKEGWGYRNKLAKALFFTNSTTPPTGVEAANQRIGDLKAAQVEENDYEDPLYPGVSNDQSVMSGGTNFTMASNAFVSALNYIIQKTDESAPGSFIGWAQDADAPDPQWHDAAIGRHYRIPHLGEIPPYADLLVARLPVEKSDPEWGYNALYTRGGIEFNLPVPSLGQLISGPGAGSSRLFPAAKYVYKAQRGSLTVDDLISDIMIEDAFGVDRYTGAFSDAVNAFNPPAELPLYTLMRQGWWEQHASGGALVAYGPVVGSGGYGTDLIGGGAFPGVGAPGVSVFLPKVALGQVQQAPDTLRLDLETAANSHEAIRKVLDVLKSNFYLNADEYGRVRGRYLMQDGLPRLIPPAYPALQPDNRDREFYCMTAIGYNRTMDLPQDVVVEDGENPPMPLKLDRETTFSGEVVMDVPDTTQPINGTSYPAAPNPYPADTNTLPERVLFFQPVFLSSSASDPNGVSVSDRDLSDRDHISSYRLYRRRWNWSARRWQWDSVDIPANADGTPAPTPFTNTYRGFYALSESRQTDTYKVFWVVGPDKVDAWSLDVAPPPTQNYDPRELVEEAAYSTDAPAARTIRPLVVGYDYRLSAITSLSFPRDDFDQVTRVQLYGQRNALSNPDLVQEEGTRVIFTTTGDLTRNPFLPKLYATAPGLSAGEAIKAAISRDAFNGGSDSGFILGWLPSGSTHVSDVINSCSNILVVDEPSAGEVGHWFEQPHDGSGNAIGCSTWWLPSRPAGEVFPGSWELDWDGFALGETFTELKIEPTSPSSLGWPKVGNVLKPRQLPWSVTIPGRSGTSPEFGWWSPEGKAQNLYYLNSNPATQNADHMKILEDRVRGGYVQDARFSLATPMAPSDDRIATQALSVPDDERYFELFTLDFGKEIEVGEIGLAVGYAPYALEAFGGAQAQIGLGPQAKHFRWIVKTGGKTFNAPGDNVRIKLYDIAGFADPTPEWDGGDVYGALAASTTWNVDVNALGEPGWLKDAVRFWVTHEDNAIRSTQGGAPVCEFFLQLEVGKIAETMLTADGDPVTTNAIQWQVITTDQRLITRPEFYKWAEDFFKNYPVSGRYLRLRARRVSPVEYSGFLTRCHNPQPFAGGGNNTGLNVTSRLRYKGTNALAGGTYALTLRRHEDGSSRYAIGWNGAETDYFSWASGRSFDLDGGQAGILTVSLQNAAPYLLPGDVLSDDLQVADTIVLEGKRHIGNGEYWYAGVNLLPSFAIRSTEGTNRMKLAPWFGALPPVFYHVKAISIQKLYVLQKAQIRQEALLQPDPLGADPRANEWYDPKIAALGDGLGDRRVAYQAASVPRRSMTRLDRNGRRHHAFNHRSMLKQDPSSYTEGRALTTAWQVLQEAKVPRQGASVNVVYFPELRVFQTVLVDERCVKGVVYHDYTDPDQGPIEPFGRTMLIGKLSISKQGPTPSSSITLRDYQG